MNIKKIKKLLFILIVSIISFNIETVNAEDTESVCKANTNVNYNQMCLYHKANEDTISLITYAGNSDFMLKIEQNTINGVDDDYFKNIFVLPKEVTINAKVTEPSKTLESGKTLSSGNIMTTIPANYNACPIIIKSYSLIYDDGFYFTVIYNFSIDDSTEYPGYHPLEIFYLSDDGIRDSKTCEVLEQTSIPKADDFDSTDCDQLISEGLQAEINKALKYVRIFVPILIIILGMVDFGRAVLAGKEDEMKKIQATFMKRIIIGVAIFLLPTIINLLLDLANTAWKSGIFNNSKCGMQ